MRDPHLTDRAKAVYLFMRSHRTGWSLNTSMIAEALNRSRNTVMSAINDLIEAGYVERLQGRIGDGKFGTVEYVVHSIPRCANVEPRCEGPQNLNTDCSNIEQGSAQNLNTDCSNIEPVKKTRKKTIENTREKTTANAYTEDFEKFWQTYPKRTGKQAAFRRWKEAVKRADPTVIIEKAGEYARSVQGTEKRYIKNPEGWLNAGRYEDEVEAEQEYGSISARLAGFGNRMGFKELE
ncbi:helix-turn-helix domain-containing protein [Corynebacterium glyciniphilum]|uniref:helix-turn-helix domain-containing protein n=1 Tax=Corynebacterium glyciniphilum TaxID=1404244 RepID=UPI0026EC10AA|nr:helix-turn-helix domain-containing protein [Corynebacterium glyciniphilum]